MKSNSFWTIPNILSLYRIVIFPFIFYLILTQQEFLFSIFITISLVTDILDGWIARTFKLQTEIGAKLDSWADLGTYILAFLAIYIFKWSDIKPHSMILVLFFVFWLVSYLYVFYKFRGLIGLHTYMFKLTGYFQGGFIVYLFLFGFQPIVFYFALIWGTIACIEEIIIIALLREPKTNVKGLYWVLKNHSKNT
ncbi:CDP-alcohol phosphatidyltransferase family protein [Xanthocytophaga flava]|uniref:CDP-alcohol phosphatidyltransferase family protein n=1 Tax=Xanthocytophaga flava TaxID=3048013 RepID=UPI0028D83FBE|nr:CDP-alcohol phosphatidyltransferase family protein [Xanthocytophaga flavus]MDJ1469786.1 CDP-alcohol phosphatidyltransferase family protein [Xanthocytophaga flavus]